MFGKKKQKKYYRKRWKKITDQLHSFESTQDVEALHKLRVNVKKLRALLFLCEGSFYQDNLPKPYRKIRRMFKDAGMIRCAGMNVQLLRKYGINDEALLIEQQLIVRDRTERFIDHLPKYEKNLVKAADYFLDRFYDIEDRYLLRVIEKQVQLLDVLLTDPPDPPHMHNCRKRLKNLLYIKEALDPHQADMLKLNSNYLEKLEDTIGNLHDVWLAQQLLLSKKFSNKELLEKLQKKSEALQKTVHLLAKNFKEKVTQ